MIRSAIRSLIRKKLGETTAQFWSDAELNTWINDGCRDIAFYTKCLRTNKKMNITESTSDYTLSTFDSTLTAILEVYYYQDGNSWERIESTSREQLDAESPGWKSDDDSTPQKYWWSREEDKIGFWPPPDGANDGDEYAHIYFSKDHADLSLDTASPALPTFLHPAIVDYVVATGQETRGSTDLANNTWNSYFTKLRGYMTERHREKEDETIVMRSYRSM